MGWLPVGSTTVTEIRDVPTRLILWVKALAGLLKGQREWLPASPGSRWHRCLPGLCLCHHRMVKCMVTGFPRDKDILTSVGPH